MEVIREVRRMQEIALGLQRTGKTIGFVPTMGYLHEGHLSLVRAARKDCDLVVVSIFVNPLQFGPREDFATYPRDLERDLRLAEAEGVDYVFVPSVEEMYPQGFSTYVEVTGELTEKMCGRSRPGHFRGVTTVVMKLFQIVQPTKAYFGQKDAQQALVIRRMVQDLNVPVEVITCPIVREEDGLAMSSRNVYLNPEERKQALALPQALNAGKELVEKGERDPQKVRERILEVLQNSPGVRVDYVEVCNGENLADLEKLKGPVLLAAAVWVGKARLIDNIYLEVE
ncbi:MAG: Pantothenate synthetase [Thermoanaerobacterales bacterium 50_218]|nr:MAG: Pantothenate synthetase [Thermoanaerobacterales bacterium 50_218]HAA89808.1 pantoate--beta-alanine ligase [Peptococcaceae bacterium]